MKTKLKKEYEKPAMQVFTFESRTHLLTLSNPGDYPDGGDPFDPISLP